MKIEQQKVHRSRTGGKKKVVRKLPGIKCCGLDVGGLK